MQGAKSRAGATQTVRPEIRSLFRDLRLSLNRWSNGPGDTYTAHSHGYRKILFCAEGTIEFTTEPSSDRVELQPGDRLDIPPGVVHSAVVGPQGVTCAEAARRG